MDHYRLLSALSGGCRGGEHVLEILECASPSIDKEKEDLFAAVEERGERMFFSQSKLEDYFRRHNDRILDDVLACGCDLCEAHRGEPLDALKCRNKSKQNYAWILVPIMIYLGKFHFVYPWLKTITTNRDVTISGKIGQIECKHVSDFDELFQSNMMEKKLFPFAYERVWCMFNPVRFEIDSQGQVVQQNLSDWARFPYQNEGKEKLPQGQSSTVTYAEISAEYVDESVERRMNEYQDAIGVDEETNMKVYRIVRKAVKVSDDKREGMQNETLSLLAVHKDHPGADNIITLLGLYTWRGNIHYVFPFVRLNLADLIAKPYPGDAGEGISEGALSLPDVWLWREVMGVAKALHFIHEKIPNPFPGDPGKVFAFHFDLKPENILVKWHPRPEQRRLQITDFGRSQIRLFDIEDEKSSSLYPGDLKYMAPEAWTRQNNNPLESADEELRVRQNYDVWSLACIMLELLIYLGAEHERKGHGVEALKEFEKARGTEMPPLPFFADRVTKSLVSKKIQSIHAWLADPNSRGDAHGEYIDKLKSLLLRMFVFDMYERASSEEVVNTLQEAGDQYSRSRSETDALHLRIRRDFQHEQRGYREVGWRHENDLVSFLTMEDVQIQVFAPGEDGNTKEKYHDRHCCIQLLYMGEGQGHAGRFLLKWGLRRDQAEPVRMLPIMNADKTQIVPKHLYQAKSSEFHECMLLIQAEHFPAQQWKVTIGFKQRAEAQAFQGSLLHYRIIPDSEMYISRATWKMWHKTKRLSLRPSQEEVHLDSNLEFEFWEKDGPNYYCDFPMTEALLPQRPRSQTSNKVIAIFRKGMPLLILPLNINDKRFQHTPPNAYINVDYNYSLFKKFVIFSVYKECRRCQTQREVCRCNKSPWDERSTFSTVNEPAIPLELTLLNPSTSDQSLRLRGIIETHELVNACFTLQRERVQQDVAYFKKATVSTFWRS